MIGKKDINEMKRKLEKKKKIGMKISGQMS